MSSSTRLRPLVEDLPAAPEVARRVAKTNRGLIERLEQWREGHEIELHFFATRPEVARLAAGALGTALATPTRPVALIGAEERAAPFLAANPSAAHASHAMNLAEPPEKARFRVRVGRSNQAEAGAGREKAVPCRAASLLVAEAGRTTLEELSTLGAEAADEGLAVLGVVLHGAPAAIPGWLRRLLG